MPDSPTAQHARFEKALALRELAETAGKSSDPLVREYWLRGLSPLSDGQHGAKAQAILETLLRGPSVLAALAPPTEPPEPDAPQKSMLHVGVRRALGRMTGIAKRFLTTRFLIQGPTGSGKSNLIWLLIRQLVADGIRVSFSCGKNEGRKLLGRFAGVIVLNIPDLRENLFKPVGDAKRYFTTFWSEFARAYRLRRETVVKLIRLSLQVLAGQKEGDPSPSLYDFACLLHVTSKTGGDRTLETAALALESLNATLGEAAMVREGPCAEDLFPIVVVQCHGLPPEFLQFLMAVRLYRTHEKAIARGHSGELTSVIISDEGALEFGRELAGETGSGYITPQKRLITQFRSTGTGLIIAAQSVSALDPAVVANVGSFICLRAQTDADVRVSGRLLGLPDNRLDEIRQIPRWSGLFKSPDHNGAVLVDIPEIDMGEYMSDRDLERLNRDGVARLNADVVFAPSHEAASEPVSYREVLGETTPPGSPQAPGTRFDFRVEHRAFIDEVLAHPTASVVEHYSNLGWSAGRGTRVKNGLVENGLLTSERQVSRNGRPVELLVLTEKGVRYHDIPQV
jgi:DNA polymerase III delta prime subunit